MLPRLHSRTELLTGCHQQPPEDPCPGPWCCVLFLIFALLFHQPAIAESFKSAKLLVAVSTGVDYVFSADLNGDGKLDLVYLPSISSGGSDRRHVPQVLLGNGDGTFAAAQAAPLLPAPAGNLGRFAIADVNKDGKLDLIVVVATHIGLIPQLAVFLGNGDGTFQAGIISAGPSNTNIFPNPTRGWAA